MLFCSNKENVGVSEPGVQFDHPEGMYVGGRMKGGKTGSRNETSEPFPVEDHLAAESVPQRVC